ncbi:MAG: hypothetical protein WC328_07775 [Kiritimatiellia bacterium]|jgi:hypothetical protein|nr:hypothetical protein [Kiritimatiellia bacterium]
MAFGSLGYVADDWKPTLTATSSVHIVTALSNTIPEMKAYVPTSKSEIVGYYKNPSGIDGSETLYLFSDDTYMRISYYSFAPLKVDDMGRWELANGLIHLTQEIGCATNKCWWTADRVIIPVKWKDSLIMLGSHWGFSLVTAAISDYADMSLWVSGYKQEEKYDGAKDASIKSRIMHQWESKSKKEEPGRNVVDWAATRVTLSDSEIAHFHKRAKDVINDDSLWKRLGQKYEGPFEIKSEDFGYECERLAQQKATVAVIVPVKRNDFPHAWFVKIVFRQYYKDNPEKEVESISCGYWP